MSEQLKPDTKESLPGLESNEARSQLEKLGRQLESNAEKEKHEGNQNKEKQEARKSVEKLAISGKEKAPASGENQRQKGKTPRAHKKQTYRATMNRVEAQLPTYQRTFSRFINAEPVDRVSTVAAKTVARPSGMLGSSVVALLGLLAVTVFATQIGFEIKPSIFILLLVLGWFVGLVLEALYKVVKRITSR